MNILDILKSTAQGRTRLEKLMSQNPPESVVDVTARSLLADCERRAIELYYTATPEKLAGDCRRELVAEFGEYVVTQMLTNGIGNNLPENAEVSHEDRERQPATHATRKQP